MENTNPFLIVSDRLVSEDGSDHHCEVLWHIDAENVNINGLSVKADTLNILVPSGLENVGISVIKGQLYPEMQGFISHRGGQLDLRPVPTVRYTLLTSGARLVTLIYPEGGTPCPVSDIEASAAVDDTLITLIMQDGSKITLDEAELAAD